MDKKTQVEQSIWSVRINSQLLYKKAVDGRTILLGMTGEENEKVAEVMSKAIDDIAKILEKRTTKHESIPDKEQITTVDTAPEEAGQQGGIVEEKEERANQKPVDASQPKIVRGPGGKFVSKNAPKADVATNENTGKTSSFFKKLIS